MSRIAFYSGSFDPLTNGHLDVIEKASALCDRLVIGIGSNATKAGLFSNDERVAMIHEAAGPAAEEAGVELQAVVFSGLAIEAAKAAGANLIMRGLRDATDFDYEMQMAGMNAQMAPQVRTVFLPASPKRATSVRLWCARSRRWAARFPGLRPPMSWKRSKRNSHPASPVRRCFQSQSLSGKPRLCDRRNDMDQLAWLKQNHSNISSFEKLDAPYISEREVISCRRGGRTHRLEAGGPDLSQGPAKIAAPAAPCLAPSSPLRQGPAPRAPQKQKAGTDGRTAPRCLKPPRR